MNLFFWLGVPVALLSAARSTYSPCGLSMLSSITPFGERGRGHRYYATATWYVAGAVLGGLTLGGGAALLSLLTSGAGSGAVWTAGGLCLAAALVDCGAFGPVLPLLRRQVDDRWLSRYRPWAYGVGFGWQIGVGVATYLMTTGVLVVAALGVLSGRVVVALALGGLFGLARGLTVFVTAPAATPNRLRAVHARIDRLGPSVRAALVSVLVSAALVAALTAGGAIDHDLAGAWAVAAAVIAAAIGAAAARARVDAPALGSRPSGDRPAGAQPAAGRMIRSR